MQRSGQAADRISKGRQSQKAGSKRSEYIGSPGKQYRGNAQNVSRDKTRLRGECKEVSTETWSDSGRSPEMWSDSGRSPEIVE